MLITFSITLFLHFFSDNFDKGNNKFIYEFKSSHASCSALFRELSCGFLALVVAFDLTSSELKSSTELFVCIFVEDLRLFSVDLFVGAGSLNCSNPFQSSLVLKFWLKIYFEI